MLCACKIVEYTNIVVYIYTMVKHTQCCYMNQIIQMIGQDDWSNINMIKGFVGVKVVLCLLTTYFACKQICTKCFVNIQIF